MNQKNETQKWAEFRFSVVGPLLSAPPDRGKLQEELLTLSNKTWKHPTTGSSTKFSIKTIERWYYLAKRSTSPVKSLTKKTRSDVGRVRLTETEKEKLREQYKQHPSWSYQLHYDNFVVSRTILNLGPAASYSTIKSYLQSTGYFKIKRRRGGRRQNQEIETKLNKQECRSFENGYVNGLWHLDFHHCSRQIITSLGEIVTPIALAILDDHSRICCHIQWYLTETTEDLVHGFCQALQKRDLPRALMTDNGSAMMSQEFTAGLLSLSISHMPTLPYSPHQNGKQEVFWGQLEGRLLAMLENKRDLSLKELNDLTIAWAEIEYNKKYHQEIKCTPLEKFLNGTDVSRQCCSFEDLKKAFRQDLYRTIRKSDVTVSIEGRRFEIPYQYRHLPKVIVRYARWDLSFVHLIDFHEKKEITRIYPLDKTANSNLERKLLLNPEPTVKIQDEISPLLKKLLNDYQAEGVPPAYLPKDDIIYEN